MYRSGIRQNPRRYDWNSGEFHYDRYKPIFRSPKENVAGERQEAAVPFFPNKMCLRLEAAVDATAFQFRRTGTIWEFHHPG